MLVLHAIIASTLTLGYVRSLYVPSKRLHKNRDVVVDMSHLLSRGLHYLLNSRRNYPYEMIMELLDQIKRDDDDVTARRQGQYEMMWDLLRNSVLKDNNPKNPANWLRQATTTDVPVLPVSTPKDPIPSVVERQLQQALGTKTSALYDKPFLQKKGDREFLVLRPGDLDPFVTVVPNDIYYSVQKTCVNWLEDCNEQGIRAKLFRLVKSPYL